MCAWDRWTYRKDTDTSTADRNFVGYDVEAANGSIGTVDGATDTIGSSYLIVDAGRWVVGARFTLIPVGTIDRIDGEGRRVTLGLTKDQVTNAPPFDPATYTSIEYRDDLGEYYARFYHGNDP